MMGTQFNIVSESVPLSICYVSLLNAHPTPLPDHDTYLIPLHNPCSDVSQLSIKLKYDTRKAQMAMNDVPSNLSYTVR